MTKHIAFDKTMHKYWQRFFISTCVPSVEHANGIAQRCNAISIAQRMPLIGVMHEICMNMHELEYI